MDRFGRWIATSKWGGLVKGALAALLGVALEQKDAIPLPAPYDALAAAAIGGAVPLAINWLNRYDARYGLGEDSAG